MEDTSQRGVVVEQSEVTLVDFVLAILSQKWLVLGAAATGLVLAALYLVFAPDRFKTEARVLPPAAYIVSDLAISDYLDNPGLRDYTSIEVFNLFVKNFNSQQHRRSFFDAENLVRDFLESDSSDQKVEKVFLKKFSDVLVLRSAGKGGGSTKLTFFYATPAKAVGLLNKFIQHIDEVTIDEIYEDVSAKLGTRKRVLKREVTSRLLSGKNLREDYIVQLKEALEIAEKLNIQEPQQSLFISKGTQNSGASLGDRGAPLYLRGTKALSVELSVLLVRKNDAPFIAGLRQLEEELELVSSVNIDKTALTTLKLDHAAEWPDRPDNKPKMSLMILGGIGGFFLGLVLVFMRLFLRQVDDQIAR